MLIATQFGFNWKNRNALCRNWQSAKPFAFFDLPPLAAMGILLVLGFSESAIAASTSSQFQLSGYVTETPTVTLSDLQALPATTVTLGSDTYVGVSLNTFLSSYIKVDPGVPKNDILRDYVLATGTDGYRAVFSMGELNTSFGNQNTIIAYQLNGQNLTTNGFARLVAPGDVKAGRWVSNLDGLYVGHVPYEAGSGGVSTQFAVSGQVSIPLGYSAADLPGTLYPSTVTVNTPPLTGTSYTGVSLWELLNQSALAIDPAIKNDILGKYVVATGTDGYQAVFSLGELSPNFGNQADLVAYANGAGTPLGSEGFARIVVPGDVGKGGRYVSNLVKLEVLSVAPVPLPPAALLFLGGIFSLVVPAAIRGQHKKSL